MKKLIIIGIGLAALSGAYWYFKVRKPAVIQAKPDKIVQGVNAQPVVVSAATINKEVVSGTTSEYFNGYLSRIR